MHTLITWVTFGLIVGIVVNILDPDPKRSGIIGAAVLGSVGAVVGGVLANMLNGALIVGSSLLPMAVALVGSLVLVFISKAFRNG